MLDRPLRFMPSYAPLFALLAIRFGQLWLILRCGGLAVIDVGARWLLPRLDARATPDPRRVARQVVNVGDEFDESAVRSRSNSATRCVSASIVLACERTNASNSSRDISSRPTTPRSSQVWITSPTPVNVSVAIGADVDHLLERVRAELALYVGGMGTRGQNFYHELACRYGYEAKAKLVQDLYIDGKNEAAAAVLPDELVRAVSLVGPHGYVRERPAAFRDAGVTTLYVTFLEPAQRRVGIVGDLRELVD